MYVVVRSQDQKRDSRLGRYVKALGILTAVVSWERNDSYSDQYTFNHRSTYGSGAKNAINILKFNWHIIRVILKNKAHIETIHAIDLDTGLVCFFLAKLFKIKFVYESFDNYSDSRNFHYLRPCVNFLERAVLLGSAVAILPDVRRLVQYGIKDLPSHLIEIQNVPLDLEFEYCERNRSGCVYVGIFEPDRKIVEIGEFVGKLGSYDVFGYGALEKEIRDSACINYKGSLDTDRVLDTILGYRFMISCYDISRKNNVFAAPNKYFESIVTRTPLITNTGTLLSESVSSNNTGIVFDDYSDLLSKITISERDYQVMVENLDRLSKVYVNYWPEKIHEVHQRLVC